MQWASCRLVAFDTETTGLNPFDGDRIIEFGAVEIIVDTDGTVRDVHAHDFLINPGIPIPREASRISGITDEHVKGKPPFEKVASKVRDLLSGSILVAHNFMFDMNFLRMEFARCSMFWPATVAEVDSLVVSQRHMSELRSHKLEVVCRHLGVPLDQAHRASHDAEACGRALVEMARRMNAPADMENFVDWAEAVSPPPDTGHLVLGAQGVAEFVEAPWAGETVEAHPDHLHWMLIAQVRQDEKWQHRYPDSVRRWARRYLRARCAGRRSAERSLGAADWSIDPPAWS